ncbi:hypothetical protein RO3G_01610 [Lichtheimia corymbifera JMRC:FSU:9682]|uniref:CCHC-type domain-containing protein n=1 Tax=Lichtheimia corymbifera JMRC:FSU:9682 TaxID=1263082 RepID=A0A068SGP5_9FUNG|nr:hypothetical protein RO3G_01610 [Lichtheimia corymbifera JMRC:FSU:9682]
MTNSDSMNWSQVAAKAAGMKVVTATTTSRDSATMSMDILFEAPEFSKQLLARKAAAIIRQALSPHSVLFSFPLMLFDHRTDAYKEIQHQIGPFASVRPLSNYDIRARKDILIAVKFIDEAHTKAAIESGIIVNDVVYKASPTSMGAENPLVRIQLNLLHNADDSNLKDELLASLKYYGKVYQIRRTLCNGFFEGQITVTIDPSAGYVDEKGVRKDAQPLQRMLYLETWDVFAPASFKGAAPICYYCRQAGHIRKTCPELAKRVCFGCGNRGHTKRYCREIVPNEEELLSSYASASAETTTTEKLSAPEQSKEQDITSKDHAENKSTASKGYDTLPKGQEVKRY